jgi:hypothetical protein
MSNMSYCRFENTDRDLSDCEDTLSYLYDGDEVVDNETEVEAAARLIERCYDIVELAKQNGLEKFHQTDVLAFLTKLNNEAKRFFADQED